MTSSSFQSLAEFGAERLINSIPLGLLMALVVWLVLRAIGRLSSRTRFFVWFLTLLVVVALPFRPHSTSGSIAHSAHLTLPGVWAAAIFGIWLLMAALAATRIVVGLGKLRQLRKHCVQIDTSTLPQPLQETVQQFSPVRNVELYTSVEIRVPTAIGFFKPAIVIPEWALRELSVEELKIILLHEFTHLRRWDDWTNLAQKIVGRVFFFHPAVWWIEQQLSLEREMACDEAVLAETENPSAYASCLVVLAEKSLARRGLALAQAAISRARDTSLRLARILGTDSSTMHWALRPVVGGLAALVIVGALFVPGATTLIAFNNAAPSNAIHSEAKPQLAASPSAPTESLPIAESRAVVTPAAYHPRVNSVTTVKTKQIAARPPRLVRTAAKQPASVQEFFVVTRTAEYDDGGLAVWRVCVWRVSFTTEAIERGFIAKSL